METWIIASGFSIMLILLFIGIFSHIYEWWIEKRKEEYHKEGMWQGYRDFKDKY